jgi:NAD-dependent dihydropyrimidine dehydrogenase PreA subunit
VRKGSERVAKIKSVVFFVFTGTGNTLRVAEAMKAVFEEKGVSVRMEPMEKGDPGFSKLAPESLLGLAFPVAMQSTYPHVWRFLENLPANQEGRGAFMVDTLAGFSGGIVSPLKKLLEGKGFLPLGAEEVKMPSNYSRKERWTDADADLVKTGEQKAAVFARQLLDGDSWAYRMLRRKMSLGVDPAKCIRCGICAGVCPVSNIALKEGLPVFWGKCVFCQRCISLCPVEAIRVSGKGFVPYRSKPRGDLLEFLGKGAVLH